MAAAVETMVKESGGGGDEGQPPSPSVNPSPS